LNIATRKQYFRRDDRFYAAAEDAVLPYSTTGDWATDSTSLVLLGDDVLRQDIGGNIVDGKGALLVRGATVYVDTLAELTALSGALLPEGQLAQIAEWHSGSRQGSHSVIWRASVSKSLHGVMGWSPTVPSVS